MDNSNLIVTNEMDKQRLAHPNEAVEVDAHEEYEDAEEALRQTRKGNMLESDLKAESFVAGYRPALN